MKHTHPELFLLISILLLGCFTFITVPVAAQGSLDRLEISLSAPQVFTGENVTATATGYDAENNSLGIQTAIWSINSSAGGAWTENNYTTQYSGVWIVNATVDAISATAILTVLDYCPITVTVLSPGNTTYNDGNVLLSLNVETNSSQSFAWYSLSNGTQNLYSNVSYSGPVALTDLPSNTYNLTIYANNTQGLSNSTNQIFTVSLESENTDSLFGLAVSVGIVAACSLSMVFFVILRRRQD